MTRDEILTMPAGRQMDVLIAKLVMGWTRSKIGFVKGVNFWNTPDEHIKSENAIPDYSTDNAAAFLVLEKFDNVAIYRNKKEGTYGVYIFGAGLIVAETFPLAMGQAALLAVMETPA